MAAIQIYPHIASQILALLHRRIREPRIIAFKDLQIQICPHVFNPITGRTTAFFIDNMMIPPSTRVLEIGTGTGAIAVAAARLTNQVIATDVSPFAVKCATKTVTLNSARHRVKIRQGDLFAPVLGESFDIILFNPPYFALKPNSWDATAWSAGSNFDLITRFLSEARQVLAKEGQIQILFSSRAPLKKIMSLIRSEGYRAQIIAKKYILGFLERIYLFRLL